MTKTLKKGRNCLLGDVLCNISSWSGLLSVPKPGTEETLGRVGLCSLVEESWVAAHNSHGG